MSDKEEDLGEDVGDVSEELSAMMAGDEVDGEIAPAPEDTKPAPVPKKAAEPKAKRAAKAAKAAKVSAPATPKADTVCIQLEENDDIPPTGLFVGLNGRGYLIRVGEPVTIPRAVKEILDHAVRSTPRIDPVTRQITSYRERMRYPYRTVTEDA